MTSETVVNRPPAGEETPSSRRWGMLATLGMGVALIVVDITIVNVSIPRIITDLDLEAIDAGWINTSYALAFATLLITLGRAGDLWGRKRLFLTGMTVFGIASALAGRAGDLPQLLGARFAQGVGAAMILPATLSIVNATFRGRDRAIAFGVWGSLIGGMAALGPLVGGWLTTTYSWRWAFFVNLPLVLVTTLAAHRFVTESHDLERGAGFDLPGFFAVSLGVAGMVLALTEGARYGWWALTRELSLAGRVWPYPVSPVPLALLVGVGGLATFVRIEKRRKSQDLPVMFDFGLFAHPSFRHGNVIVTIVGLGEFGLVFVLPLYLQTVLGYTPFETGKALVAMAAGGFLGGPAAAGIARRFGARQVVSLGMGAEALGVLMAVSLLGVDSPGPGLLPGLFVYGLGVGLASAQLTSIILLDIPVAESGQASGMQSTFRQMGAALGVATMSTVYVTTLRTLTHAGLEPITRLAQDSHARIVTRMAESAGWYIGALRVWTPDYRPVVAAAETAIVGAARAAGLVAFGFFLLGFILSRRLPDV